MGHTVMSVVILSSAFWISDGAWERQRPAEVSIDVFSPVSLGEPVFVRLVVRNPIDKVVEIDLGANGVGVIRFALISGAGKKELMPEIREGIEEVGFITVAPFSSLRRDLVLNRWCQFPKVGVYRFEATLSAPTKYSGGEGDVLYAQKMFDVEIVPRDEIRLRRRCEALSAILMARKPRMEAIEDSAARDGIRFMLDGACVPAAKRLLQSKMEKSTGLSWLKNIGDEESIKELMAVAQADDRYYGNIAKRFLIDLEPKIGNSELRDKVKDIIKK